MPNQELINYIDSCRKQGIDDTTILNNLRGIGWDDTSITLAFQSATKTSTVPVTSRRHFSLLSIFKRPPKVVLIIVPVVLVLLCGTGAYAAYQYFNSPDMLMDRMIGKLVNVKMATFNFSTSLNPTVKGTSSNTTNVLNMSTELSGSFDISDDKNPKMDLTVGYRLLSSLNNNKYITNVKARTIYLNKKLYGELLNYNDPSLGTDLQKYENSWYYLDQSVLDNPNELMGGVSTSSVEPGSESVQQLILSGIKDKKQREIIAAFLKYKVFTVTKIGEDKINGVDTDHLHFVINQNQAVPFLMAYDKINYPSDKTTENDWKDFLKQLADANLLQGDVWIGKSDMYPYKIKMNIKTIKQNAEDTVVEGPLTLLLSNFNKSGLIVAPKNAKDAAPIIKDYFQQLNNGDGGNYGAGYGGNGSGQSDSQYESAKPLIIQGSVFDDLNGNGVKDANENSGVSASVQLYDVTTETNSTFVRSEENSGSFFIQSLLPGEPTDQYALDIYAQDSLCPENNQSNFPFTLKDMKSYYFATVNIPMVTCSAPSPMPVLSPTQTPPENALVTPPVAIPNSPSLTPTPTTSSQGISE